MPKGKRKAKRHPNASRLKGVAPKRKKNAEDWKREDYTEQELREALAQPDNFGYSGDLPLFETWSLGPVVDHRDASLLAKANWKALEKELKRHKSWENQWQLTGANHWAVGWVEHLSFEVLDDKGEPTDIALFLKWWFGGLQEYPIADEELYSSMQFEAYVEQLEQDLDQLEARKLKERLPKKWRDKMVEKLRELDWDYDERDVPYHTEATLEEVAKELGYLDEELEDNPTDQPPTWLILRDPWSGTIVSGELLMVDARRQEIILFDDVFQSERAMVLSGDQWFFADDPAHGFEIIALATPCGRYDSQMAANPIGPGLGAAIGSWAGTAAATMTSLLLGFYGGAGGIVLAWTIGTLGAAVGGNLAAEEDRKRRVAIGGAVGNALFPILGIGAAVGGWIGGKQPDPKEVQELRRRRNKERLAKYDRNPSHGDAHSVRKIKNRVLR